MCQSMTCTLTQFEQWLQPMALPLYTRQYALDILGLNMSESELNHKVYRVLNYFGYCNCIQIATSIQGSVWRASHSQSQETAIFKLTNRSLHRGSLAECEGKLFHVQENICLEQSILKYLTQQDRCPNSIVKWKDFFKTNSHYWLEMEDGGQPLFDFIKTSHELISKGKLDINEWKKVVKIIFKQMVECVDFLHANNVCHNDISLENFVINAGKVALDQRTLKISFLGDIQIKLCDFGLANLGHCISNKYCGKTHYKSPEVINRKRRYNAKANDIWCLGICLFAMSVGFTPWDKAHISRDAFELTMNGYFLELLVLWDVLGYLDRDLIDLFESIFQYEETRISIKEIKEYY